MSTTAKTPTPAQLKAYSETLPDIYRRIFRAFHDADPERRYGDGVSASSFWSQLLNSPSDYRRHDFRHALDQLRSAGFLHYEEDIGFWQFTGLGEELLGILTGGVAQKVTVPDLPKPNW